MLRRLVLVSATGVLLAAMVSSPAVASVGDSAQQPAPISASDEVPSLPTPAPFTNSRARLQGLPNNLDSSCDSQKQKAVASGSKSYSCTAKVAAPTSAIQPNLAPPTVDETFNSACGIEEDRWFYSNRFTGCYTYGFAWQLRDVDSQAILSEVSFAVHQEVNLFVNGGTKYTYQIWLTPYDGYGVLLEGGGVDGAILACSTGCTSVDNLPYNQPVVLQRQLYGNFTVSQPTAAQKFTTTVQEFRATLSAPAVQPFPFSVAGVPNIRCDSGFPERNNTTGCVYQFANGVYALSVTDPTVNETAAHIVDAQERLAGHPGRYQDGSPLNYISDSSKQKANRRAVCGNFVSTPGGSCDEYPFASTTQGGVPSAVSVEDVALDDNTAAGGRLGNTVQSDRLLNGEPFWALMLP